MRAYGDPWFGACDFRLHEKGDECVGVVFLLLGTGMGFVGVVSSEGVERERCIMSGLVNLADVRSRRSGSTAGLPSRERLGRGGVALIPSFA